MGVGKVSFSSADRGAHQVQYAFNAITLLLPALLVFAHLSHRGMASIPDGVMSGLIHRVDGQSIAEEDLPAR